jgi:hypothetical protein
VPELVRWPHALEPAPLARLRKAVLSSPFVGGSPLAGGFYASRGFAVTFRLDGLGDLLERFPYFEPYLRLALSADARRALLPWPLRLAPAALVPAPNAFYLNVLLLDPGEGVGLHVDGTLRAESGVRRAVPQRVSVLYLAAPPPGSGGELHLVREWRTVGRHAPEEGTMLLFRGSLKHEVLPFHSEVPGALRASLVCEQYRFAPGALERIPRLAVHSRNGFRAHLEGRRLAGGSAAG